MLKYVQTPAISLKVGMSANDVIAIVTPYPVDLDGVKLTFADFGDNPTFTVDPKISAFEEINGFTGITDNGDNAATLTGLTRNLLGKYPYTVSGSGGKQHGSSAVVVFSDNPQRFSGIIDYINSQSALGSVPATTVVPGIYIKATQAQIDAGTANVTYNAVSYPLGVTPDQLLLSGYGTRLPTANEKTLLTQLQASMPGVITQYGGRSAPTGWFLCDGSLISRTGSNAVLFGIICPSGTFTVTIATPAVFTKTSHGYVAGDRVHFTTTGALPTGLSLNTDYYVISAGLTTNAFEVALTPGGAAVNTTGTQSGVHTVYASAFGKGDGSTTFALPDLRSRVSVGLSATAPTETLSFEPASVTAAADTVTILNTIFPSQGQLVRLTSTGTLPGGLALATDYYIIRASATTIKFATSIANANSATAVDITDQGTGVHTITYTNLTHPVMGRVGGEENHELSISEMPAHTHLAGTTTGTGITSGANLSPSNTGTPTSSTGGDAPHNNMQPYIVVNYIIKQ